MFPPLPSPLSFLTSLFHPTSPASTTSGTLFSSRTQPVLLTLHCLFPTELLAALDVLDRRLVTRFVTRPRPGPHPRGGPRPRPGEQEQEQEQEDGGGEKNDAGVYYVRSSRRMRYSGTTAEGVGMGNYEVRLRAWNCTCPAFAFAAFGPRKEEEEEEDVRRGVGDGDDDGEESGRMEDGFGGLGLGGRDVPVCKHLLACLLVEWGGGLGDFVNQRVVGKEEIAGWAAGWGG